jgi:hypothetical protein
MSTNLAGAYTTSREGVYSVVIPNRSRLLFDFGNEKTASAHLRWQEATRSIDTIGGPRIYVRTHLVTYSAKRRSQAAVRARCRSVACMICERGTAKKCEGGRGTRDAGAHSPREREARGLGRHQLRREHTANALANRHRGASSARSRSASVSGLTAS